MSLMRQMIPYSRPVQPTSSPLFHSYTAFQYIRISFSLDLY